MATLWGLTDRLIARPIDTRILKMNYRIFSASVRYLTRNRDEAQIPKKYNMHFPLLNQQTTYRRHQINHGVVKMLDLLPM